MTRTTPTYQSVLRQISCNGAIPMRLRASEAQLRLIALLVVKTGCPWDTREQRGYTAWQANGTIKTLKEYEAVGGYAAWVAARDAHNRALGED